jgi:hypothetical protein
MKERPILFSAPMVQAILEGRKSQTRRVMNPQPTAHFTTDIDYWTSGKYSGELGKEPLTSPYGQPGDRLWVRETWAYFGGEEYFYQKDRLATFYRATWESERAQHFPRAGLDYVPGDRWRPSIHMPRWASRITLELTKVRVERVNEISEADVRAEGIQVVGYGDYPDQFSGKHLYQELWDKFNGEREGGKYAWAANPWVYVLEFKRL